MLCEYFISDWILKMGLLAIDIVMTLVLNLAHCAYSESILPCNVTSIEPCPGANQICNATSLQCSCMKGFYRNENDCEFYDHYSATVSATAVVVSTFTLALVICGLILVAKKYNFLEYIHQKYNSRNNNVGYEDVMIGQDDPPLSL